MGLSYDHDIFFKRKIIEDIMLVKLNAQVKVMTIKTIRTY